MIRFEHLSNFATELQDSTNFVGQILIQGHKMYGSTRIWTGYYIVQRYRVANYHYAPRDEGSPLMTSCARYAYPCPDLNQERRCRKPVWYHFTTRAITSVLAGSGVRTHISGLEGQGLYHWTIPAMEIYKSPDFSVTRRGQGDSNPHYRLGRSGPYH